ncbi:MAG TPA: hypothetical protein VN720_06015 [Rudaea sp.]|nr:hypothetical protein [Rudaea sp.]
MFKTRSPHVIGSYLKVRLGLTAAVAAALSCAVFARASAVPSGAAPVVPAYGQLDDTAAHRRRSEVPPPVANFHASPVPAVAFAPDTAGVPVPPIL